ncbi:MAG: hypothetical protein IT330_10415 [Anaerolineae bacterium]|nr:hypothetical protein [Anaerolineae bacterium]
MVTYDLGLAWEWPYDADFVALMQETCHRFGLSCLPITHTNVAEVTQAVAAGNLSFQAFLDRAWDAAPVFHPWARWAETNVPHHVNPYRRSVWAIDKATMHLECLAAGLLVPYTYILAPHDQEPHPAAVALTPLGDSFYVKPAHGGGGAGVIEEATSWEDVLRARLAFADDKYLVQEKVVPAQLGERPAWFRVLHACGTVFPCWWDRESHAYAPVTYQDEANWGLGALRQISRAVATIAGLRLFSTEIGVTAEGRFLVVDAVNDPCDLRCQSCHHDGVPDDTWRALAREVVFLVAAARRGSNSTGALTPYPLSPACLSACAD